MNIQEMMRQMQRMQKKLTAAQEEAKSLTAEGTAGGGMVVVVANGANQIVSVKVEKEVVDPEDVEMLQDLMTAASNQALSRVQEKVNDEIGKVTGGMGLPGMPGMM